MKRILAILLAAMLVFSLAACGDNSDNPGNTDNPGTSQTDNPGGNTDNPGNQEGQIVTGGEVGAAAPTEIVLPENVKMVEMYDGNTVYRTTIKLGNDYYTKDVYGEETFWKYIEAENKWQVFSMSDGAWDDGYRTCSDVEEIYAACFATFKNYENRNGWSALSSTGRSQTILGVEVKEYSYTAWEEEMFTWLSDDGISFTDGVVFLVSEWNTSVTSFGFDTP